MLEARGIVRLHLGPIDLHVRSGTCVSLMGASGSGKSILLRAMADLDPHGGEMSLDNLVCSAMPAPVWRSMVTYVAADAGWWAPRVGDQFADANEAVRLLPSLGLDPDVMDWSVSRLSTGERQRLALLRALQPSTRVLLLDEPTSGLDERSFRCVEALLQERLGTGLAVLWVTHDAQQARRVGQRHFLLENGSVRETEP